MLLQLRYSPAMSDYLPGTAPAEAAVPLAAGESPNFKAPLFCAALLSAILPGAGHFIIGRWRKGVSFASAFAVFSLVYWSLRLPQTIYGAALPIFALIFLCVFATCDAAYAGRDARTRPSQWWLAVLLPAALLGVVVHDNWEIRAAGFAAFLVPSSSMAPTIPEGGRVMVDRWYYRHAMPRRGEIIVAISPSYPGIFIAKRVIAVSGETIEVRGDTVLINGQPIEEPYAMFQGPVPYALQQIGPVTLPNGKLFVMGDNRHVSLDSRIPKFGLVDVAAVRGKVIYGMPSWKSEVKKFD